MQHITSLDHLKAVATAPIHVAEFWRDVGGPESGPKLIGHPQHEVYTHAGVDYMVVDGEIVDSGPALEPGFFDDIPF